MKTDKQRFNRKRLKALIALVVSKCGPIDEAALCWALFNIDMEAYLRLGKSITGATYVKGETHPIPCHL